MIAHRERCSLGGDRTVQALVELIAGFIAMLAAVALAQFGVDLTPRDRPDREVHRVANCDDGVTPEPQTLTVSVQRRDC